MLENILDENYKVPAYGKPQIPFVNKEEITAFMNAYIHT
jgi:hypothetical protein